MLNLSFAFVELFYGIWTNSLGLISDAFHMFFDCTALIAGLVASVITRWPPNDKFSFGYVRAEVIAGFVNGLFLVFIAFYIFTEAIERLFEPPEVKHDRLFIISVLGLLVNLVGIFVFQHGGGHHGHSHGDSGHSHESSHSDDHRNHHSHNNVHGNALLNSVPSSPVSNNHGHSHNDYSFVNDSPITNNHSHNGGHHGHSHDKGSFSHGHSHHSQIMQGVFLHILADTLGSVGVIISAILMNQFGWMIADPICSMFIALLVAMSVYPLLRDSIGVIMQRTPRELEGQLQSCYHRITSIEGVYSIHEAHFWTLCTDKYVGSLRIEVSRTADYGYVQSAVRSIFTAIGVKQVYLEIHFANT
jgi:zinc transporter 5/7